MILCPHCYKPPSGKRPAGFKFTGESTVVLSRQRVTKPVISGKQRRTVTMFRTRKCDTCRFSWRTIEIVYSPRSAGGRRTLGGTRRNSS